jgi:hypothetical protein
VTIGANQRDRVSPPLSPAPGDGALKLDFGVEIERHACCGAKLQLSPATADAVPNFKPLVEPGIFSDY